MRPLAKVVFGYKERHVEAPAKFQNGPRNIGAIESTAEAAEVRKGEAILNNLCEPLRPPRLIVFSKKF